MRTETRYFCDFCDKSFPTMEEYKKHEATHLIDFNDKTNEEISSALKELADRAWDYHVGESVMGMPADNFVSLVSVAAKRLRLADNFKN